MSVLYVKKILLKLIYNDWGLVSSLLYAWIDDYKPNQQFKANA